MNPYPKILFEESDPYGTVTRFQVVLVTILFLTIFWVTLVTFLVWVKVRSGTRAATGKGDRQGESAGQRQRCSRGLKGVCDVIMVTFRCMSSRLTLRAIGAVLGEVGVDAHGPGNSHIFLGWEVRKWVERRDGCVVCERCPVACDSGKDGPVDSQCRGRGGGDVE